MKGLKKHLLLLTVFINLFFIDSTIAAEKAVQNNFAETWSQGFYEALEAFGQKKLLEIRLQEARISLEKASTLFEKCASMIGVGQYCYNSYFMRNLMLMHEEEWSMLADAGDAQAIFITALPYLFGGYLSPMGFNNIERALVEAAKQGFARSQFTLGWMYENFGTKVQAKQEANVWYRKAEEQGHAAAQFQLGRMYLKNEEVDRDQAIEARELFRKAATQEFPLAQLFLGLSYGDDEDLLYMVGEEKEEKDDKKAIEWIHKAAYQGEPLSQFLLGSMYEDGAKVEKDKEQAEKWYCKAKREGFTKRDLERDVRLFK
ncbi:MAG: hypothetical protein K0R52_7 [Alphaproteobacteria bacterium]|jgi:TPR repeat protein|nr:hypothetical protein [Alphaproteobacteria bacterium]